MLVKIVISGIYLQFNPAGPIKSANLAMADEADDQAVASLEEKELELRKKEKELEEKEMELKKLEEQLLPLQDEINTKIEELNDLQTSLTAYAKDLAERENALQNSKIGHLVTLYSSMEAANAASIMDKLQIDTIVLILSNMKGKSAGQILAMMNPEKGALISERLSKTE